MSNNTPIVPQSIEVKGDGIKLQQEDGRFQSQQSQLKVKEMYIDSQGNTSLMNLRSENAVDTS